MNQFDQQPPIEQHKAPALTFRLEMQDLETYNADMVKKAGEEQFLTKILCSQLYTWGLGVLIVALVMSIVILTGSSLIQNFWFFASLVLLVALVIIIARQSVLFKDFAPANDGMVLGKRSIELEDEGLIITQEGVQQAFMWHSIKEVYETSDTIYLMVDTALAHMLPKNIFPSAIQAQEFAAYARERVSLSRPQHGF